MVDGMVTIMVDEVINMDDKSINEEFNGAINMFDAILTQPIKLPT